MILQFTNMMNKEMQVSMKIFYLYIGSEGSKKWNGLTKQKTNKKVKF